MFRFLQGLPRALRSTIQAGYNTHHRSPAATHHSNHQEEVDNHTALSTLLPIVIGNNSITRLHSKSDSGNDNENGQNDWKSFNRHHQWQSFNDGHDHFEAVGWGTAILLSLQLQRGLSTITPSDDDKKKHEGAKHMLASIAHAMPMLDKPMSGAIPSVRMKVLDEGKENNTKTDDTVHQFDAKQPHKSSKELEDAFQRLHSVSEETVGMVHNTLGLEEARQGNLPEAAEHFRKGSSHGYSKAQFNMAVCYEQGRGVSQDLDKAVDLYEQAATQGHAMAQYNLGVLHLLGRGSAQLDSNRALELISAAAGQGLTQAQSYLGAHYLKGPHQDTSKAVELLKQAANKMDKEALYHLGVCYQYGLGIESNTAKAASYYHKAARRGYMPAVYSLGTFYEQGMGGLPESMEQAKRLYDYASHNGYQEAKTRLKQLHEAEKQEQKAQRNAKTVQTLKRNKTQSTLAKPIHTSASEPVLSKTVTKAPCASEEDCQKMAAIVKHLSYLALYIPYYSTRGPDAVGCDRESDNIPVRFQVGGPEESDISGLPKVSESLKTGLSVVSVS